MGRHYTLIFLCVCFLCLIGCKYTITRPEEQFLYGTYLPTKSTQEMNVQGCSKPTPETLITLSSDGTFLFQNIPDCWRKGRANEPGGGFDSGKGTWQIAKHQNWWVIEADFEPTEGFSRGGFEPRGLGAQWNLVGEKRPYSIQLTVGDPDSGAMMEFEQVIH